MNLILISQYWSFLWKGLFCLGGFLSLLMFRTPWGIGPTKHPGFGLFSSLGSMLLRPGNSFSILAVDLQVPRGQIYVSVTFSFGWWIQSVTHVRQLQFLLDVGVILNSFYLVNGNGVVAWRTMKVVVGNAFVAQLHRSGSW